MKENIFLVRVTHDEAEALGLVEKFELPSEAFRVVLDNETGFVVLRLVLRLELLVVLDSGRVGDTELETGFSILR